MIVDFELRSQLNIINSNVFIGLVENYISKKKVSYMEAILEICKEYGIDVEDVPKLITPTIKKILRNEALSLNLIKKQKNRKSLPI